MSCSDRYPENVSRETIQALTEFHDILLKWNKKINLVSTSSTSEVWNRHIWDSAQLMEYASDAKEWVDIGAGGGFPGLVIAIISKQVFPTRSVTLVESDQRKSAFLRTIVRTFGLSAKVLTDRVEELEPLNADVLSARALASLPVLLGYADRHLKSEGKALFLKGQTWKKEVQTARDSWSFDLNTHTSKTSPDAAVLEMKDIMRV